MVVRPFNSTRFCDKPRIDTPSPTPKSLLRETPVIRCSASAMLLSGSLPTSSATIASTIRLSLRFKSAAFDKLARIPVTTISSRASLLCDDSGVVSSCAATLAEPHIEKIAAATIFLLNLDDLFRFILFPSTLILFYEIVNDFTPVRSSLKPELSSNKGKHNFELRFPTTRLDSLS